MKIVVITNDALKAELLQQGMPDDVQVEWQHEIAPVVGADAYVDLLFIQSEERINKLTVQNNCISVASVTKTSHPVKAYGKEKNYFLF